MTNYSERNNLITKFQSGFRKNHNCESLINLVVTNWKMAVHDKKVVIAVFLDLRRAFETVDQNILLKKLEMYGVNDVELSWFRTYVKDRKQRTKINGILSEEIDVVLGVPQGSVLGVLLFLIYINDMEKAVTLAKLVLFADDALLYVTGDSVESCLEVINADLKNLNLWFKMYKLKLNVDKTKCMILNGSTNEDVKIEDQIVQKVSVIKYLGVMIDDKLEFKEHIDYICKKIAKKTFFFFQKLGNLYHFLVQ